MYSYRKSQLEVLFDLVREANPDLPLPLNPSTASVGVPVTQTVVAPSIADTNILIYSKDGSYLGGKRVQYRRIDLAVFFKGMTPVELSLWNSGTTVTAAAAIEEINRKFGTSIDVAEVSGWVSTTTLAFGTTYNCTMNTPSVNYRGVFSFVIRKSKRPLDNLIPSKILAARNYQGGNAFPAERKPQGEYISYNLDFSPIITSLTSAGTVTTANTTFNKMMPWWRDQGYPDLDHTKASTVFGGLLNLSFTTVTLPHASYPEANSDKFKYALVISPLANGTSWFQGRILCQYNL